VWARTLWGGLTAWGTQHHHHFIYRWMDFSLPVTLSLEPPTAQAIFSTCPTWETSSLFFDDKVLMPNSSLLAGSGCRSVTQHQREPGYGNTLGLDGSKSPLRNPENV
jgi:hypothetical protein